MVSARFDGPALAPVDATTLPASPGEFGESQHFFLQRMVERDRQRAVAIHLGHLAQEVLSMIRAAFQDIVLPLMDHFMGDGAAHFGLAIWRGGQEGREERKRETDFTGL